LLGTRYLEESDRLPVKKVNEGEREERRDKRR
jgi:hypothetical protein